ncbi:ATP-binding cassette domain-containing protein [Anaerocolumna sp. AGMB13025]|uniref:sulfate/molybdate ABC transporter ATP-binding protein n=1 Tax=Anaerocolumna sp. AGMB13025 TaxID=3039116 RepID=UPI00241F4E18|nr:ATP-binding cassette domain-containing protein [Anaerocolumna sp. AGMB13025]WFR54885.1 ATP-binding cassette domain-containing protein [Anaerocolumna sp. AGMB13025]
MSLFVDITKKFKGFSLRVKFSTDSERMGLLGASGCGKSMTLKCIAGIEKPDEGCIILNDKILFDSKKKIDLTPQKRKVGYLFQNYALFPNMTVEENIGCGLKGSTKEKQPRIAQMVELLHLQGLERRYPMQLSGGQQQRVALARILAYEPDVLMLDEPFSALDAYLKENLQQELLAVLKDYSGDTLIVSHNRDEIYSLCENIAIIDSGTLVLSGKTSDIFQKPIKLAAARLTGCKNISKAKKISEYELEAVDWGIVLQTADKITDRINYVGIRAHDIRVTDCLTDENAIPCKPLRIVDSPFERNIILECASNELWWKISKAYWRNTLSEKMPDYIRLPRESLMLLE